MSSSTLDSDMLSEVLSHSPDRSISGFFLNTLDHCCSRHSKVDFVPVGTSPDRDLSLDFLPCGNIKIEACDASHGILLCATVNPNQHGPKVVPEYIVCKPSTTQYQLIRRPKTRYFRSQLGLMVIRSNPLRYKIFRFSASLPNGPRVYMEKYSMVCEIFDSDSWTWKRLGDVKLNVPFFSRHSHEVSSYGSLHWITMDNKIFKFCLASETWSLLQPPMDLPEDEYPTELISYEDKLGVICSKRDEEGCYSMWVLQANSKSLWHNVEIPRVMGPEEKPLFPVWFHTSEVVTMSEFWALNDKLYLGNIKNGRFEVKTLKKLFLQIFPFVSD